MLQTLESINSTLNAFIWGIADTCNGFMAIPNLIALILMSGTVAKLTKEYFSKK